MTPDGEVLLSALRAGLEGIQALGAAAGDKTMVDAWEPAVAAFERTLRAGGVTEEAARNAAEAANAGVEATLPMQARKGRASYLGSRSIGHQDPGATSTAIIFGALERALRRATVTRALRRGDRRGTIQSVDRAARILKVLGAHRDSASPRSRIGWGSRRQPSTVCSGRSSSGSSSNRTPTTGSTGWERPCSSSGTRS